MTDVNSGEVLACVTYPGYDNNRLANQMDIDYYAKLSLDLSRPFFNKATQQKTAPGSTFKIVTAVAGMEEGIVDDNYGVTCTGEFTKVNPPIKCWLHTGHGYLGIQGAIKNSCNTFFNQVVYDMGTDSDGNFSDSLGLEKLRKYAELFQLDQKSGIEITEAEPRSQTKQPWHLQSDRVPTTTRPHSWHVMPPQSQAGETFIRCPFLIKLQTPKEPSSKTTHRS